jgi:S-formylglutathione hydrolase FrmB
MIDERRRLTGMKHHLRSIFALCALGMLFALTSLVSCSGGRPKIIEEKKVGGDTVRIKFESKAIASGKMERFPNGILYVSLPASYASSPKRRYPVVYALHGFGDPTMSMIDPFRSALDEAGSSIPDVIIVAVEGTNSLGGSFYANSPATGNWEDLVTSEAVSVIDGRYRTIAEAMGRILSGFSMGGFGAWNIALTHPEIFSGAWVCCPGAWDGTGLADALDSWGTGTYTIAYGAAYSSDLSLAKPYGRYPRLDGSAADAAIIADWQQGFGNAAEKAVAYAKQEAKLKAVSFVYGSNDAYPWIPRGTVYVADKMKEAGIPVTVTAFDSGHSISEEMITGDFIPYIQKMFGN